jgi:hypothetical protein
VTAEKAGAGPTRPPPEELEPFMNLRPADVARIVLCLLVEEGLKKRLAAYRARPQHLPAQPVQRQEELLV